MIVILLLSIIIALSETASIHQRIQNLSNVIHVSDECAHKLIALNHKAHEVIASVNNEHLQTLTGFGVVYNYKLQYYSFFMRKQHKTVKFFYLINIDGNAEDIFKFLYMINQLDASATYILKINKQDRSILKILFRYYIYKVIFISMDSADFELFGYSHKKNTLKYTPLGNCNELLNSDKMVEPVFEKPTFTKINVISWLYEPYVFRDQNVGINNQVLNIIWNKMNIEVKYNYILQNNGNIRGDNFTGLWKDLLYGQYDMFGGMVVPEGTEFGYFERSFSALEDSSYFVVPYIVENLDRLSLFQVFDTYIWIALFVTLIIVGVHYYCIIKLLKQDAAATKFEIIFKIYQSQLENPPFTNPKSFTLRTLLIFYLYFSLIMNSLYKSKLFNASVKDNSHQMYESLKDIVDKHLEVGIHEVAQRIMIGSENYYERYIAQHSSDCSVSSYCLNRTGFDKNFATVKMERSIRYFASKFSMRDEDGTPRVHIIKSYTLDTVYFSYFFQMGHPLVEAFNKYLMILKENGFIQKMYTEFDLSNRETQRKVFNYIPLTVYEFEKVFFIYGIGIAVCLVGFCLEYLQKKYVLYYSSRSRRGI